MEHLDFALISKSTGVGLLSGVITSTFLSTAIAFFPIFVLGFGSIYWLGKLNQRMSNIESNINELTKRLDNRW